MEQKVRCGWADSPPINRDYHDNEWGRPVHDDKKLFELFFLETMQAGLSWITILKKREAYRQAFDGFDPAEIAAYGDEKIQALLQDPKIVRNRLKVQAAVHNAGLFLQLQQQYGSFDAFVRSYAGEVPLVGGWKTMEEVPARTPASDALSKALKKRGFKFAGSVTVYAFMQAAGFVNDHLAGCFAYREIEAQRPF